MSASVWNAFVQRQLKSVPRKREGQPFLSAAPWTHRIMHMVISPVILGTGAEAE